MGLLLAMMKALCLLPYPLNVMKKILQINITANWGSHGRIAENIGLLVISKGWDSYIGYGRRANQSKSHLMHIGSMWDERWHGVQSRLIDNHGLASSYVTKNFVKEISLIKPDLIHLHNIHGYYLNYPILFRYLSKVSVPIVWTLHDCWPITGHCAYFDYVGCSRWKNECCAPCPCKKEYPRAIMFEATKRNFQLKKKVFNSVGNITLVPVSDWLGGILKDSFLSKYPTKVIKNGIDLNVFKTSDASDVRDKYGIGHKRYVLGVASVWEKRKGFDDFLQLAKRIPINMKIVLVGLDKKKLSIAQKNDIIGIPRTENVSELVALYSGADIFLNLTYEDNYPTTNLEAMACGTPVLTYKTGGSPESVSLDTGWVVEKGDIDAVKNIILTIPHDNDHMRKACRERAEIKFDKNKCFEEYLKLYEELLKNESCDSFSL